jgi:hypothetical protein
LGLVRGDVHITTSVVDDVRFVPPLRRGLRQPGRRVERWLSGQNSYFQSTSVGCGRMSSSVARDVFVDGRRDLRELRFAPRRSAPDELVGIEEAFRVNQPSFHDRCLSILPFLVPFRNGRDPWNHFTSSGGAKCVSTLEHSSAHSVFDGGIRVTQSVPIRWRESSLSRVSMR